MRVFIPTIVLLALTALAATSSPRPVCKAQTSMRHNSVQVPFSPPVTRAVPLTLHYRCDLRRRPVPLRRGRRPLLILVPGALLLSADYSNLARRLARRGFVVAIPEYSRRRLIDVRTKRHIQQTRRLGFDCPRNGQFASTELINSVLKFFLSEKSPRSAVRRITDLRRTVIFGHSLGGAVSQAVFNFGCAPFSSPVRPPPSDIPSNPQTLLRSFCEQYAPFVSPDIRILGMIGFESIVNTSVIDVSRGTFYVEVHSPFNADKIANFFAGKSFNGTVATVLIKNANHYGPNNYVTENDNQKPVCAFARMPPEDEFTTKRSIQNRVIRSIASVVRASYGMFVLGRRMQLKELRGNREFLVKQVRFF